MAKSKTTGNGWTKEHIQHMLDQSDLAVERALIQLYRRQTEHEQQASATTVTNGVGFTAFDAELLTSIAEKCFRFHGLTTLQTIVVRRRIKKYWKQLLEIAADSDQSPRFVPPPVAKKPKQQSLAM